MLKRVLTAIVVVLGAISVPHLWSPVANYFVPPRTDFDPTMLGNHCGGWVTLVGVTAPAQESSPTAPLYELNPANGSAIRVHARAASLPQFGRRLSVTGTVDCSYALLAGGREIFDVYLVEHRRQP